MLKFLAHHVRSGMLIMDRCINTYLCTAHKFYALVAFSRWGGATFPLVAIRPLQICDRKVERVQEEQLVRGLFGFRVAHPK